MYDHVFLDAFFSMPYSQEALPVIFSNETAILRCSVFVLKTMCKTLIMQAKTGASMGMLREIFQGKRNVKSLLSCRRRVNLFWCLHLLISSDLWFNKLSHLYESIFNFSLRHITFTFGYVERCAFPYYSPGDFWCEMVAFIVQYSLDSSVSFLWCSRLNDFVWFLNLCLKSVSAVPMYFFRCSWAGSTLSVLCK